jgi:hypothetical protein
VVEECQVKKQEHKSAKYIGSAAAGLEFYDVVIPETENQLMVGVNNCGKVYIDTGEITKEEFVTP